MRALFLLIIFQISLSSTAREGMWLPQLLGALNEADMKSMGMQISAEDIYSINQSSLKDAVLQFGGGCTGEMVSASGLLFTNHHCGYSQIQSLSTVGKNYLEDGFWAEDYKDELPCPGLTATFIREITDVTDIILKDISDTTNEDLRTVLVKIRSDSMEKSVEAKLKGIVRAFYHGNKYYLFSTEVYKDVRFVGAPPQSIGKFGGETDNWVWPRHTGDFSLFRIYADSENQPAAYSVSNVPYQPKQFLKVNISGVKEGGFIFVFGFPGKTNQYLISSGLETIANQTNPNRIAIRDIRLDELRTAMRSNDTINLQYSSKFYSLENSYKKWKGELLGFRRFNAIESKKTKEDEFKRSVLNNPQFAGDTSVFSRYDSINSIAAQLNFAYDFYFDAFSGIELLNASARFNKLIDVFSDTSKTEKDLTEERGKCVSDFRNFYKNYNTALDKRMCRRLLNFTYSKVHSDYLPLTVQQAGLRSNGDFMKFTDDLYDNSLVADSTRLIYFVKNFNKKNIGKIKKDPAFKLKDEIATEQRSIQLQLSHFNQQLNSIQRKYISDLMELKSTRKIFPDANSTLRVSYGRVEGVIPQDGMEYKYYSTTEGILQKSQMDVFDYKIPPRLSELLRSKDFGRYGKNGELPVSFLSSSHTTGGNSGSPVLNAKGELVGINYDRMWEGVLSDYHYDEVNCRNISLDIRYALFVIEKYGNAMRLVDEMHIIEE